jgi:predicted RNA-binding protein with TRAM domain
MKPYTRPYDAALTCGHGRAGQSGAALLVALLILGALSTIATSLLVISYTERQASGYYRDSLQALASAETGAAFAKRMIQDLSAPMGDMDSDGQADFSTAGTLSWGGEYETVAEATDITGAGVAAYRANGYTIVTEGTYRGALRRVRVQIVHDSFLKYARFVSVTGTSYDCGALLTGEVYVGGDLGVPNNCGTEPVEFLEFVAAVGNIPNAAFAVFHRGYVTGAEPIDLENSVDFASLRARARGQLVACDCDGRGEIGLYVNVAGGIDPLALGAGTLNFSLFDFCNTTAFPPDTVISYNGTVLHHALTGENLLASQFNGLIFFENDAPVQGTLDGHSARSISVFATDDVIVRNNIYTGHTGFDETSGLPNGSGEPVNLGLIAYDYLYLHQNTPRVLQIDAAVMSCHSNWRVIGGTMADHPVCTGPLDLDCDGITGETPHNNDPAPGTGWDELNVDSNTWVLNINGPIITYDGGSAWPWNEASVLANADGPTRRYNYDLDVTEFPPPCFPVPLNLWKDVTWTEIVDSEADLTSYLPE